MPPATPSSKARVSKSSPKKVTSTKKRARSPEAPASRTDSAQDTAKVVPPTKRSRASTLGGSRPAVVAPTVPEPKDTSSKVADEQHGSEDDDEDAEGESDDDEDDEDDDEDDEDDDLGNEPEDILPGSYDLYGMELPFMNSVYAPKGGKLNPAQLYETMLKYQGKNDRTAKITIPYSYSDHEEGSFQSGVFRDPFSEEIFDVGLSRYKVNDKPSFKSTYGRPENAWDGPSIQANMFILDEGCGISSSSGTIHLQPLWKQRDKGNTKEIFEGTFTLQVKYGAMYSRKGHGSGQKETIPFWAIRAD